MFKRKVLAIGGVPCSGKTTLILRFIKESNLRWIETKITKLIYALYNAENNIYILGKYDPDSDEVFQGTDKISMQAPPELKEFIQNLEKGTVIFEGDRFFGPNILEFLAEELNDEEDLFRVLVMHIEESVKENRYDERESVHGEPFQKSRKTKINNILRNLALRPHLLDVNNNTKEQQDRLVQYLRYFCDFPEAEFKLEERAKEVVLFE